mmetsp:Transcript_39476/g.80849  ORF Transcript_39476/g.80849 Transcript_39476/m.80849 type:complete len:296 (+) Transcript_39476:175-1062(+)
MSTITLFVPSPLFALAKSFGIVEDASESSSAPGDGRDGQDHEEEFGLKDVGPHSEDGSCADLHSLNTFADSVASTSDTLVDAQSAQSSGGSDQCPSPNGSITCMRVPHRSARESAAPTRACLPPDLPAQDADAEPLEEDASLRCAIALTRLKDIAKKLEQAGAAQQLHLASCPSDSTEVTCTTSDQSESAELAFENRRLRNEVEELQLQLKQRDEFIMEQTTPDLANWRPLQFTRHGLIGNILTHGPSTPMESVVLGTPRTRARVLAATCSSWLATPVPLDEAAPAGTKDKLITL